MIKKLTGWKQKEMKISKPIGYFKIKPCRWCKENFQPIASSHLYCSDICKDKGLADNYYRNVYNSSLNKIEELLEKQNNLCFICEEIGFKMNENVHSPLNVDHCHQTGVIRGLLCHNCNRALGLLKDDIHRLKRAISYLESATTISKESTPK